VPEPRPLPHDPYITAVLNALDDSRVEPTDWRTSDAEINQYETGPFAGLTTQLDALLTWDGDAPGLNTATHEDGFVLLWEHPAEQWQWAPRKRHGALEREPEFLTTLPRWASPGAIVATVRDLLAGRAVSSLPSGLWEQHEQAQAAVDAWAADD
jgi:hypothetical protein